VRSNPFSSFQSGADAVARRPIGGSAHVKGPTSPELVDQTIGQLLDATVAAHGDRDAFVFVEHGVRLTWRQFRDAVDHLACGLLSLGVERGDRVGIWSPNRPEWVLVQFATARIGAVMVNINLAYRVCELEYALHKVTVKMLFTAAGIKSSDYLAMLAEVMPEMPNNLPRQIASKRLPELRTVVHFGDFYRAGMFSFDQITGMGVHCRGAGLWCARPALRRGDLRLGRSEARRVARRHRITRFLPRPDRALQGAAAYPLCRGLADDGDGQGAEVRAARGHGEGVGGSGG